MGSGQTIALAAGRSWRPPNERAKKQHNRLRRSIVLCIRILVCGWPFAGEGVKHVCENGTVLVPEAIRICCACNVSA